METSFERWNLHIPSFAMKVYGLLANHRNKVDESFHHFWWGPFSKGDVHRQKTPPSKNKGQGRFITKTLALARCSLYGFFIYMKDEKRPHSLRNGWVNIFLKHGAFGYRIPLGLRTFILPWVYKGPKIDYRCLLHTLRTWFNKNHAPGPSQP